MTQPDVFKLYDVCEATWPAAGVKARGGWVIRDGKGGGKRVSACTADQIGAVPDIAVAEAEMTRLGQPHLFMIRQGEGALDAALDARGYDVIDRVNLYAAAIGALTKEPADKLSGFAVFPPLAVMKEIWEAGGIGPARVSVMERARVEKTSILGRLGDHVAGTVYVGLHEDVAMVHALEVSKSCRRRGMGRNIMRNAVKWAQDQGAAHLAVIVTQANVGGNALYTNMGMQCVGQYHYRIRTDGKS